MKTLRNQSKAYNVDDSLNDEYSVTLFGNKYPLLSKTMKGYTSKLKKAGKARFNKLFNGSDEVKRQYIKDVSKLLNLSAKGEVGDDTKNPHKVKVNESIGKEAPLPKVGGKVPLNQTPDSLAVFQKLARKTEPDEPEEDQALARQEAKKKEDEQLSKAQQEKALTQNLPNTSASEKFRQQYSNLPQMSRGGMLKGKSHKRGGIPMKVVKKDNPKLDDVPVDQIEVEGGEYIINRKSTKEFKPLLKQINQAGNEARDAKGTPDEAAKKKRLQQLKNNLMRKKYRKGSEVVLPSNDKYMMGNAVKGTTLRSQMTQFYNKWKGNQNPSGKVYERNINNLAKLLAKAPGYTAATAKTQLVNKNSRSADYNKMQNKIVSINNANYAQKQPPAPPQPAAKIQGQAPMPQPPKQQQAPAPSGGAGLMARLSQDDNVKDTSDYPIAVGKYFSKLDFSRTLSYVKRKHKNVESMSLQQIQSMCQDLASDLQLSLKYMGDDLGKMKAQLYQLLAIKLGRDKSKEANPNKTVGLVVDVESVFGSGSEIDKEKIAKHYRAGGLLDVKKYARGGETGGGVKEPLKQAMENEDDLEKLVKRGDADFTTPKPEAAKQFSDFQNLGNTPEDHSVAGAGNMSFKRKTFDLASALLTVERDQAHRFAQEIDDPKVAFTSTNLFRKKRGQPHKRKNLLDGL